MWTENVQNVYHYFFGKLCHRCGYGPLAFRLSWVSPEHLYKAFLRQRLFHRRLNQTARRLNDLFRLQESWYFHQAALGAAVRVEFAWDTNPEDEKRCEWPTTQPWPSPSLRRLFAVCASEYQRGRVLMAGRSISRWCGRDGWGWRAVLRVKKSRTWRLRNEALTRLWSITRYLITSMRFSRFPKLK